MFPAAKELRERAAHALGLDSAGEQGAGQRAAQSRSTEDWSQGASSQAAAEARQQGDSPLPMPPSKETPPQDSGVPKGLLDSVKQALHLNPSRSSYPVEQKGVLAIARDTLLGVAVTPGEEDLGGQESLDERSDLKKARDAEEERGGPSFAGMPFVPPGETKAPTESDLARKEAKRVGEARANAWGSHVDTTRPEASSAAVMKDADETGGGQGSSQTDLHSGKQSLSDQQPGTGNNAFGQEGTDLGEERMGSIVDTENKPSPQEAMHGKEGSLKVGTKKSFGEVGAPAKQGQRTFGVGNPQEKSGTETRTQTTAKESDSGAQNSSEEPVGGAEESPKQPLKRGKEQGQEIPRSEAMEQEAESDKAPPQEVTGGKFGSLRVGTRKEFKEAGLENKEGQVTFGTPEAQFRKLLSETGGEDQKSVAEKMSDALDKVKTTVRGKGANPTESGGVY